MAPLKMESEIADSEVFMLLTRLPGYITIVSTCSTETIHFFVGAWTFMGLIVKTLCSNTYTSNEYVEVSVTNNLVSKV